MNDYEKKYKEALDKAKRYDEVFNAAKEWYNNPNSSNIGKSYLYAVFPELKESEDEGIRKFLIDFIKVCGWSEKQFPHREDCVAWLEKQGTRPRYNIGDVICDKLCTTLNKEAQPNMEIVDIQNGMYICDKGSFPVSQQDEYELVSKKIDTKLNDDSVSNELRAASTAHAEKEMKNQTFPDNLEFELIYAFEEGAKWNAAQKPTWSKDDDDNLGMIESRLIDLLSYTRKDNSLTKRRKNTIEEEVVGYVNWLTSLKARFAWKPSDEQMAALNNAILLNEDHYNGAVLSTLREQLMKLK